MMLNFLRKLHVLENGFFFQNLRYFDNFHCTERVISIRSNILQSKSTNVRTTNGKLLTSNRSLTFAVNVDLKVSNVFWARSRPKNRTKNFVGFHNHSALITILNLAFVL